MHTVFVINVFQCQAEHEPCEQGTSEQGKQKVAAVKKTASHNGMQPGTEIVNAVMMFSTMEPMADSRQQRNSFRLPVKAVFRS